MERKAACNIDDDATSPVCCKMLFSVNYYCIAVRGQERNARSLKATPVTFQVLLHLSYCALFYLFMNPN